MYMAPHNCIRIPHMYCIHCVLFFMYYVYLDSGPYILRALESYVTYPKVYEGILLYMYYIVFDSCSVKPVGLGFQCTRPQLQRVFITVFVMYSYTYYVIVGFRFRFRVCEARGSGTPGCLPLASDSIVTDSMSICIMYSYIRKSDFLYVIL